MSQFVKCCGVHVFRLNGMNMAVSLGAVNMVANVAAFVRCVAVALHVITERCERCTVARNSAAVL